MLCVPGLHPHVRFGEAVCPVLLLVDGCAALAVCGREGIPEGGDGEREGAWGAEGVNVPVEWEREVDDPAFGCGFVGSPSCVAVACCFEGPASILGGEFVACGSVAGGTHVAHAGNLELKCVCGFIGCYALDIVDEVFALKYLGSGCWVVRE